MKTVLREAAAFLQGTGRRAAKALVTVLLAAPALLGFVASAAAEDRALKLFFTHTGERAVITFKRDGRFDPRGLAQINRFLRDWRKNEPAKMDPRLLDLVWEVYNRAGGRDYIHVVSAYRSPATNNMLRTRSRVTGVAKNSQHMLGRAMDFYVPGVKLSTLRAIAMQMQGGGVGYYPTSGSPFVHLDVGNVRAWPRMSRQELAQIFPNGRTMHLPSNGRALPGYDQAVADSRKRGNRANIQIASLDNEDEDDAPVRGTGSRGLVTALLPTPRSQAQEALVLQSAPRPVPRDNALAAVASPAVPVPLLRPAVPRMADGNELDAIETASIAPVAAIPQFRDRVTHADYGWDQPMPSVRSALHAPDMIAFLPMAKSCTISAGVGAMSPKALQRWALHPAGQAPALKAPRFERAHKQIIDPHPPVPLDATGAGTGAFDADRFIDASAG